MVIPLLCAIPACAQESALPFSIGLQGHYGSFLSSAPKARYVKDSYTYFGELCLMKQTDGSKAWQRANRLPQWGAGLLFGNTGSRRYMGSLTGAFTFITLPVLKAGRFTASFRVSAGLGAISRPYDKYTNHKNVLLGSRVNGYANFLCQGEVQVLKRLSVNGGLSFTHLSNGGSRLPNMGLNVPALSFGLRYGRDWTRFRKGARDTFSNAIQWSVFTSAGLKQAPWVESRYYGINILNGELGRNLSYSGKWAAGFVFFYNRTLEIDPSGISSSKREVSKLQGGIYASYEHAFGKISVPIQLGAYVYNRNLNPSLFQQIGLRYRCHPQWSAQVLLKSHLKQADLIHAGIGYHFK